MVIVNSRGYLIDPQRGAVFKKGGKMERIVKIGRHDDAGLHLEWTHGFEITVTERKGECHPGE